MIFQDTVIADPAQAALQIALKMMHEEIAVAFPAMMGFILKKDLTIIHELLATDSLHYAKGELNHKNLIDLLHPTFLPNQKLETIGNAPSWTEELHFSTKEGFIIPTFCYASTLQDNEIALIVVILLTLSSTETNDLKQAIQDFKDKIYTSLHPTKPYIHEAQVIKATNYIMQHLDEQITVHHLEIETAINRFLLQKGFKVLYGITINEFIIRKKLIKACEMLQKYKSPKTTARNTGYSLTGFNKIFTQRLGVTPTQYQKKRDEYTQLLGMLSTKDIG